MFYKPEMIGVTPLYSSPAVINPVPPRAAGDWVVLKGRHDGRPAAFGLTEDHFNKHLLLVGSTGCGKTTTFINIVNQLQRRMTRDDVMIIFDTKGDFAKSVQVSGEKLFLANTEPYRAVSKKWNVFRDILFGNNVEDPAQFNDELAVSYTQEICRSLFCEREKNSNNPFFPNAARDLLAALIIFLIRTGMQSVDTDPVFRGEYFNNAALVNFLNSRSAEEFCNLLSFDPDLTAVRSYIEGGGDQASGVLAEMYSVVRDIFTGVFAQRGSFSMRKFVHDKGNKTLFIEYDLKLGSVLTPVYRLLFDLALKEALGRQNVQGNVYLICDEFKLLPHLQHIDDGVNFGRSLGVKVIAGLQSIEQLFEIYHESRGKNIAAGFSTIFAYHNTDPSTIDYLVKAYDQYEWREEYQRADGTPGEYRRRGPVISGWDLVNMEVGEAIICPAFGKPFTFKFDK